jgi:broad specificity phosphatase PhoE
MNTAKTITLVRHGTTENNEKNIWQGRADHPLNGTGRNEAELLAEHLQSEAFEIIFHSPLTRALHTAEIIGKKHQAVYQSLPELIEMDLGDFDGMSHADILENHFEEHQRWIWDVTAPIPGGESFCQVFERVQPAVAKILAAPYKSILVVGHAIVNRALMGCFVNMNPEAARKFRTDNCAFSKLLVFDTPNGANVVVDFWNISLSLGAR